jgi:RHS repeat-associated protein
LSYDGENRMTVANASGEGDTSYGFDGAGQRVWKANGLGATVYAYDGAGEPAAEYSTIADASGNPVSRYDYVPFGQEIPSGTDGRGAGYGPGVYPSAPDVQDRKFTGKEQDAETGLDYFGARYLSSAQGRFTSPDWSANPQPVPFANPSDPQSLNLYSYVRNNPLKNRDLDGHFCLFGFGNTCNATPASTAAQGSAGGTGAQLLNDGVRRGQYQQAASRLSGPGASAARKALQADTYGNLSAVGQALTDAAKASRVNQLAGKTAEQLGQSASRTNATMNAVGSASEILGVVGVTVGVGMAASDVASAPAGQRLETAAGQAFSLGGAVSGSMLGARNRRNRRTAWIIYWCNCRRSRRCVIWNRIL